MKRTNTYQFNSNDPKYLVIYRNLALSMGAISNRKKAKDMARWIAEKNGWKDYWVEETVRVDTTRKISVEPNMRPWMQKE
jgi:hypothetical protein